MKHEKKELILVTAESLMGIKAHDVSSGTVEWEQNIPEMTKSAMISDGHGHLFVSDIDNKCIHMLSLSDGQNLGRLHVIEEGEQGLGFPVWVDWSEETSSLILAHGKEISASSASYRFSNLVTVVIPLIMQYMTIMPLSKLTF